MSGRAVAYIRTESPDAPEDQARAQRLAIERWAARENVAVTSWRTDVGIAGTTPIAERPALLSAYRALAPEGARVLVAANAGCFSLDELVSSLIERAALACGAALQIADAARRLEMPPVEAREENVGWTRAAIDLAR